MGFRQVSCPTQHEKEPRQQKQHYQTFLQNVPRRIVIVYHLMKVVPITYKMTLNLKNYIPKETLMQHSKEQVVHVIMRSLGMKKKKLGLLMTLENLLVINLKTTAPKNSL